jgi:hypothetical protein
MPAHEGPDTMRASCEAKGPAYRSGHSRHWIKSKNPAAPAVKREAEEDWGRKKMAVKKTTEKTRTHFTYRIDTWTKPDAQSLVQHVADVEDYEVALATFRACCERWPTTPITLRQNK